MPYPQEKVTMMDEATGGNPFRNVKPVDVRRSDTSKTTSITSVVEVTISGRTVYRPKPKSS